MLHRSLRPLLILIALAACNEGTSSSADAPVESPTDWSVLPQDTIPSPADARADLPVDVAEDRSDGGVPDVPDDLPAELPADLSADVVADVPPDLPAPDIAEDSAADTAGDAAPDVCAPACAGKQCGADGCGGVCGVCPDDGDPCTGVACQEGLCEVFAIEGPPCEAPIPVVGLTYDVVVAGAGAGGVAAAIEAARLGMSVALLEETDWLGGQMTAAGVSSMDEGYTNRESGIYAEFMGHVQDHYAALGKSLGTCYWSNQTWCFEPHVGRDILAQMVLAEPGIDLYLRTRVTAVESQWIGGHPTVTGVHALQASPAPVQYDLGAAVTIDTTEAGDLLALGPAGYRAGKHTDVNLDPSDCVQDITYTAILRRYPGGVPADLWMASPPPGYTGAVVAHFQSIVTAGGADWISGPNDYPASWLTHVGYRGTPDSAGGAYTSSQPWLITRSGVNWANDHPLDVGQLDPAVRKAAYCAAKLKTLQFLYYVQHELGQTQWSVANDEGYDTAFNIEENLCDGIPAAFKEIEQRMPVIPYVREGRRLIGMTTVTASQIERISVCAGCPKRAAQVFPDALAIGDYPVDLHACNGNGDLELTLEDTSDVPPGFVSGPFQVPFQAFVPASVDGFLVAEKNLSVTRLVNGAIRLQPISMLTGQAAGTIAGLSVLRGEAPRAVPPILLQDHLVELGCRLAVQSFADVPRSHPAWEDVQIVAARELMNGYSDLEFGAGDPLLRKEAAAVLVRAFDLPMVPLPPVPSFGDVDVNDWSYPFIESLVAAGVTDGCSAVDALFCPDDPLTRAELAAFMVKALGWNPATAPQVPYFSDLPDPAAHWSFNFVQLAAQAGLIGSCGGGQFCPAEPVSRVDTAGAMRNLLLFLVD
jgi:hypothetical protein